MSDPIYLDLFPATAERIGWREGSRRTILDPDNPHFLVEDYGPGGYGCEGDGHYIGAFLPPGRYRLERIGDPGETPT